MRHLKTRNFLIIFLAFIAILALTLSACQKKAEEKKAEVKGQKEEVIKIGAILPLTGPVSHIGVWQKNGITIAQSEINNNKESSFKVKVLFEDSKGQAKDAISAFNKLYNVEKVNIIISSMSAIGLPLVPLADEKKIPVIMLATSYPGISERSEWVFRNHPGSEDEAELMAKFIAKKSNIRKMGVFYLNDDFGIGAFKTFKSLYSTYGGNIVYAIPYEKKETNFRSNISKMLSFSPEGIYVIGYLNSSAILIKQLRESGFTKTLACNMAMSVPKYLKMVGEGFENTYFTITTFNPDSSDKKIASFVQAYKSSFNATPNIFSAVAYDSVKMIIQAARLSNGISPSELKEGLQKIEVYEGIMGRLKINKNGKVIFPMIIARYENNKLEPVWQETD